MSAAPLDPAFDITVRSSGLNGRKRVEKLMGALALLSAVLAVGVLVLVLGSVLFKGVSQLDLTFFTKPKALFGEKGGIADALVGSALIVGMAILIAVPFAILMAIYIAEYAGPKQRRFFRVVLDVLNGVPAIVVGIFIFGLLVVGHGQSAIYGGISLAILMVPMVCARDAGGARARAAIAARGESRARRAALAHGLLHRSADGDRRHPHRGRARGRPRRRRDGAAALHLVGGSQQDLG